MSFRRRYPVKRTVYTRCVGRLLAHGIGQIIEELGLEVWFNTGQSNGVDLLIKSRDPQLTVAVEILNWSKKSLLSHKRKANIINNLSEHSNRLLIYTCLNNEEMLNDLASHNIDALKIGYQLLPKAFYNFYLSKKQIELRKPDSRETKRDIKNKIAEYLTAKNILCESDLRCINWPQIAFDMSLH